MSKLLAAFAALALAAPAFAAEGEAPPPPAKEPAKPPAYAASKHDPVIGRLGLTEEQAQKVDEAFSEWGRKMAEFVKELREKAAGKAPDQEAMAKFIEQQKALMAERDKKIREQFSAELQAKFDAGRKLMEELNVKVKKAQEEMQAAMKEAAGDAAKVREQLKGFQEKVKAEFEELNKALDEKLGKLPPPPKPPAEAPKAEK